MSSIKREPISFFQPNNIQNKVAESFKLQQQRLKVAQQFPATTQYANVHYKSNMFGYRRNNEVRVCPCCLERVKQNQFDFCSTNVDDGFLTSDVVLFFAFIRMLIYYFLIRFLISDAYNLTTSYLGFDCAKTTHCRLSILQKLSVVNKITHINQLFVVDILNLAFVGISMIYFSSYDRYLYNWYYDMSVSIQTQDDFAIFVTNIPIVQRMDDSNSIDYKRGIGQYFTQIIQEWLRNTKDNIQLYNDYSKVAFQHNHSPLNPPSIINRIDLCFDLYEPTRLAQLKQKIQQAYEEQKQSSSETNRIKRSTIIQQQDTMEHLRVLSAANLDLCQQYQLNPDYVFGVSKFLGKAFITFEYEHFALLVHEKIKESQMYLNHKLKVYDAAPPRDIYRENLSVTRWQRLQKLIITFFICTACLVFSFLVLFGIKYRQRKYYYDEEHPSLYILILITIVVSLLTLLINWILKVIIHNLAQYERHDTKSNFNIAVVYKTLISVIFNQALTPFLVNIFLKNYLWASNGLTTQIYYLLLAALGIALLKALICPKYLWYWAKLKFTYRNAPPILKFQDNYNLDYALPDFQIHERFLYYIEEVYLISFYAYLVPSGSLIGVVMFMIQYFADKYKLLKHSSFHPNYSYTLLRKCLTLIQSSIFAFALGNYLICYLYHGQLFQPVNLVSLALATIYSILIWFKSLKNLCMRTHTIYQKSSYSDCVKQNKFFHTYYSVNPATKLSSANSRKQYIGVNYKMDADLASDQQQQAAI